MTNRETVSEDYVNVVSASLELAQNYYAQKDYDDEIILLRASFDALESEQDLFFSWLSEIIPDPVQQIMVISAIYCATKAEICLDRVEELIVSDSMDYNLSRGLYHQTETWRFIRGSESDYIKSRGIVKHLKTMLKVHVNRICPPIPVCERKRNRIVIITDQFIQSEAHAPTRMLKDLCRVLLSELGYEISIIVAAELYNVGNYCYNCWVDGFTSNYSDAWGEQSLEIDDGLFVEYIQYPVDADNVDNLNRIIDYIYDYAPLYVIHIGGKSCTAELMCDFTTVVAIPCNGLYAVSGARFLIRYLTDTGRNNVAAWLDDQGQSVIDMHWNIQTPPEDVAQLSKRELGCLDYSFVISIMGNRLDYEIDEQLIDIMINSIERDPQIVFVIIGECSIDFSKTKLCDHIRLLGFREDYLSVLKTSDLVLNPRRRGGGSCADAVFYMTPVMTLKDCDVASVLDNDSFVCDSYEDYPGMIHRYISDENYYQRQVEECTVSKLRRENVQLNNELRSVDAIIKMNILE